MNGGDSILGSCEDLTLSPIKNCERFECPSDQTDTSRSACLQTQGIPGFHQEPVELPALKSLNLHPIGQDPPSGAMQEQLSQLHQADTGKASDAVNEVATRFVDMLSKSIDTDPRRKLTPSEQGGRHGISMEPHVNAVFYLDKKVFLREVISAALEQLQDPTSHDTNQVALNPKVDDKEEWFQCDECPKMTRLKCELKYGSPFIRCCRSYLTWTSLESIRRGMKSRMAVHFLNVLGSLGVKGTGKDMRIPSTFICRVGAVPLRTQLVWNVRAYSPVRSCTFNISARITKLTDTMQNIIFGRIKLAGITSINFGVGFAGR
jgi:hypothetical protein